MEYQVQLLLREHNNGFHSVEVVGEPELRVYTDDLDAAREDLELVLHDRLERLHPGLLSRYALPDNLEVLALEIPEALLVEGELGLERCPTCVCVLLARDRRWQRLWAPRWDLRLWLSLDANPQERFAELAQQHISKLNMHRRLRLRFERREWLEALNLRVRRAPLSAFTGRFLDAPMLPEPSPEEEKEKERRKGKKKKPPATPTLKRIALPLSERAKRGELPRAHGRDAEVEALQRLLCARTGSAHVLIGAAGVGKSAVLNQLAISSRGKAAPAALRERPVWFADASRLIAGEGWFGDWQKQVLEVVQECIDAKVIWYIGDLLPLLDAGKSAQSEQNAAQLLKPYLAGGQLTVVGECTPRAHAQLELRDAGFARLFTPFQLQEPEPPARRGVLAAVARDLEKETGVALDEEGLGAVDELCQRFPSDGSPLGSAIQLARRLADETGAKREEAEQGGEALGRQAVVEHFCAETGMPAFLVRDDQPLDPATVRARFRRRIVGQEEAVRRMADLVSLMKAGLSDQRRPLGSFLFVGPTGVGKTEMAKALAEYLFGRAERMIRFDMSEFVTADSVHRFIGSGGQEGRLVSALRRTPFCVLLLDEIEKAHPAVFDVLLQVLGEARLSDEAGRTADFRNAVVLMTSNLGVESASGGVGFGAEGSPPADHFAAEAERFFRPEFFNRLDHVVSFGPLGREAILRITRRELERLLRREGLLHRSLRLELDPEIEPWLAARGVDARYGARPLKRLMERALVAPLASHLSGLEGEGPRQLRVSCQGESLVFKNVELGKAKRALTARTAAYELLERIGRQRYLLQRWMTTPSFQEMNHEIRLLDRLSQVRGFWTDARHAQRRMAAVERDRELQGRFEALKERIASMEELAYECAYDSNREPLGMLDVEHERCDAALDELELSLFNRRFRKPTAAVLYLQLADSGEPLLRELLQAYLALAAGRGWTLQVRLAQEDPQARAERVLAASAKQAAKPGKERARKRLRRRRNPDPQAWSWVSTGTFQPPKAERSDLARRKTLQRFLQACDPGGLGMKCSDSLVALSFEGPHCAALLSAETGQHIDQAPGGERRVSVRFGERLFHPLDVWASPQGGPLRLHVPHTRMVHDLALGLQLPMQPRLHLLYERFMVARIYDRVFGKGAFKLFDRRARRSL